MTNLMNGYKKYCGGEYCKWQFEVSRRPPKYKRFTIGQFNKGWGWMWYVHLFRICFSVSHLRTGYGMRVWYKKRRHARTRDSHQPTQPPPEPRNG